MEYARLSEALFKLDSRDPASRKIGDSVAIFHERYRAYDRDSITFNIKTDTTYNNLLNGVINATEKELLQPEKNDNRTMLDGILISFNITEGAKNRSFYARSPNAESHPLLYDLVKSTSKISFEKNLKVKGFFWY